MEYFEESHALSVDIYPELFRQFFATNEYRHWSSEESRWGQSKWTLHYSGGPGCGKTTLSALTAKRLKKTSPNVPTASIFICKDVRDESSFLTAALVSILDQFAHPGLRLRRHVDGETETRVSDQTIDSIYDAIQERLAQLEKAFLIIDGIDRCTLPIQRSLLGRLKNLQQDKLSIMVTSRQPSGSVFGDWKYCDAHSSPELETPRYLTGTAFWTCEACQDFDCCYAWVVESGACTKETCGSRALIQQYHDDAFNFRIKISGESIADFVTWTLIQEYGSSHLQSDQHITNGIDDIGPEASKLVVDIVNKSDGNITLAKSYLECAFATSSFIEQLETHDRLPSNIVKIFDAGLDGIANEPDLEERQLGLLAIAAVAKYGDEELSFEDFKMQLQAISSNLTDTSAEDVLRATKGFLNITNDETPLLIVYNYTFGLYIRENYNEVVAREMQRFS